MKNATLDQVMDSILESYISFDTPNYYFVNKKLKSTVLVDTANAINQEYTTENIADLNDDVCIIIDFSPSKLDLTIYLSLVGMFVFVDRKNRTDEYFITALEKIDSILTKFGWMLVDQSILLVKSPFPTYITENEATIFNVLFSDGYWTPSEVKDLGI
jgi:hypothetical protein